jgi:lipopolysaccharide/colanic/teichoic acid biosynthesis glycosyltransferase
MIYRKLIKPTFDRVIALLLIAMLLPFWIAGIAIVRLAQGAPIFYLQRRTGLGLKGFTMYKIRTLESSAQASLSTENRRYARFGRFLRNTGLDELPQLLNVLRGEMSIIGPRPMPVEYESSYSKTQKRRFACKPGMTGWAQVHGRNAVSWDDRFSMDNWYIDHCSFWLDIKIIGRTIKQLLVDKNNEIKMPVFTSTNQT